MAAKTYATPEAYSIAVELDPEDSSTVIWTITTVSQTSDGRLFYTSQETGEIGETAPFVATVIADHSDALELAGYEVLT